MRPKKLLARIIGGVATNVNFDDLIVLVTELGFEEVGGKGSHRVFAHPGVSELLNLQEVSSQALPGAPGGITDPAVPFDLGE